MKSDYELIIHQLPSAKTKIYPVNDLHIGSAAHRSEAWASFRRNILSDPNAYIGIGGDALNNGIKTSVAPYDDVLSPTEQKERLATELEPLVSEGKVLWVVAGNHEDRTTKMVGTCPLYDVCGWLGIQDLYRPNMAFVKVKMGERQQHARQTYMFGVIHGTGNGGTSGAYLNKIENISFNFEGLDALIAGHAHKGVVSRPVKTVIDPFNNVVRESEILVVGSTSWLDYEGYALKGGLRNASKLPQCLELDNAKKAIQLVW